MKRVNWLLLAFLCVFLASGEAHALTLSDGLLAHYAFNNSLDDFSGNGRDLSVFAGNPAVYATDKMGDANEAYNCQTEAENAFLISDTYQWGWQNVSVSYWLYSANYYTDRGYFWFLDSGGNVYYAERHKNTGQFNFLMAGVGITNPPGFVNGSWHHIVNTYDNSSKISEFWIDGVNTANGTTGNFMPEIIDELFICEKNDSVDRMFNGLIDEFRWYNRTLSPAEIEQLHGQYDTVTINESGGGPGLSLAYVTPANNDHSNDDPLTITINITNTTSPADCRLYVDGVFTEEQTGLSVGEQDFTNSLAEGIRKYYFMCNNTEVNATLSNRTVVMDYSSVDITVEANNGFAIDNSSVFSVHTTKNITLNISFDDTYLWVVQAIIRNASGFEMFNHTRYGLTTAYENIHNTTSFLGWPSGVYNVTFYAEDDHTAKQIPSYLTNGIAGGREWTTDTGTKIRVLSPGSSVSTSKLTDRYTFDVSYALGQAPVIILQSTAPLHYRGDLWPFPSFVTGKHWVDFNSAETKGKPLVEALSKSGEWYQYRITYSDTILETYHFSSLGGLNIYEENYYFTLNNTPPQVENLTLSKAYINALYVAWDKPSGVNHTLIYLNGAYNATVAGTSHNITGLTTATEYTITAYAANGTDVNYAVSSENQVTASTTINTTLRIRIYNLATSALITDNVTIELNNGTNSYVYITSNGGLNLTSIPVGNYSVTATSDEYSTAYYSQEILLNTDQTLDIYLSGNGTSEVIFTYYDKYTGIVIEGVTVQVYRKVLSNYTLISTKTTDVTGRTKIYYVEGATYRFTSSKDGYTTKTFDLDPILFGSYTIKMDREVLLGFYQDYHGIYMNYEPKAFYNERTNQLNITIYSPYNALDAYSYQADYPGGTKTDSGINPSGETFTTTLDITGASLLDTVNITLSYTLDGETRTFTFQNGIIPVTGNQTWAANKDNTYGMGLFERLLIGTIVIIIVAGLITLAGYSIWGLALGALLMGVFIYQGFWPWWAAGISFLLAFVLIAGRTD